MEKMVRVNTRISQTLNNWLTDESRLTGLSKSSIMMIATENYKREKETLAAMGDMSSLMAKISEIESAVKRDPE